MEIKKILNEMKGNTVSFPVKIIERLKTIKGKEVKSIIKKIIEIIEKPELKEKIISALKFIKSDLKEDKNKVTNLIFAIIVALIMGVTIYSGVKAVEKYQQSIEKQRIEKYENNLFNKIEELKKEVDK